MKALSIHRGYDAGNYANACETTDYERAIAKLSMNRSATYCAAFTLGFFSSYTAGEIGSHLEAYHEALALVGEQAKALGIAVNEAVDYSGEGTHTSMTYGQLPDREAFEAAFDARCPEGTFSFGNDPYVGNDALTSAQLWRELETQLATHNDWQCPDAGCPGDCPSEEAGSWCSCVLGVLGFEWI
jgi:hypothetical protein